MGKNKNKNYNKVVAPSLETKHEPITEVKPVEEKKLAVVDGVQSLLNIRSTPLVTEDNVLEVIAKGTNVIVITSFESDEWYKVEVHGTIGYAMKKFIKIL